jgi:hypothetical protein
MKTFGFFIIIPSKNSPISIYTAGTIVIIWVFDKKNVPLRVFFQDKSRLQIDKLFFD